MKLAASSLAIVLCVCFSAGAQDPWRTWSLEQARQVATSTYEQGRVGPLLGMRLLKTERSHNYKLAATWMTPDVIRATVRTQQLIERLSDDLARELVAEAEKPGYTVVMIELDPNEGSGVIPNDWSAFLQVPTLDQAAPRSVRGEVRTDLRTVKALAGVRRRNYDYDRFWVAFPLVHLDGRSLFNKADTSAELVVRIYDKEGRVSWPIPSTLK